MPRPGHATQLLATAAALLLAAAPTLGQARNPGNPRKPVEPSEKPVQTPPANQTPGQPAQTPAQSRTPTGAETPIPLDIESPYLTFGREKGWTMKIRLTVRTPKEIDSRNMPVDRTLQYKSLVLLFPVLGSTASSHLVSSESDIDWKISIDDAESQFRFDRIVAHPGGTDLGRWSTQSGTLDHLRLEFSYNVTSYETKFDEAAAKAVEWPKGPWPTAAQVTFQRQLYLDAGPDDNGTIRDYDMTAVDNLIETWTNGQDPKSIPPVTLAKWLAGKVMEHVQLSGNGAAWSRLGEFEGFDVGGAVTAAQNKRGTEFDAIALLTSVYRRAGLPARMVIGYDVEEADDDELFEKSGGSSDENLRAWVEFALWDEKTKTLTWVPVDIVKMRSRGARMPDMNRTWPYFGTNDELDDVVPLAFHFHPPTDVLAYNSPGLWGWFVTPKAPQAAEQALDFSAYSTPKRGGRPDRNNNRPGRR